MENNINESLKLQALKEEALRLWAVDQQSALDLGKALIAVRDALAEEHGAFADWFRENGLEENRVYYCIRKAEGKIPSSEEEKVDVYLYQAHLALAKLVPQTEDRNIPKGAVGVVHLGPDGVTVTDGLLLARVSLPPSQNVTEEILIPAAMLEANLNKRNGGPTCRVSLGKTRISSVIDGIAKTVAVPKMEYPPYQRVIDANMPRFASDESVTIYVNPASLRKMCDFMEAMGTLVFSITIATHGGEPWMYAKTETSNHQLAEMFQTLCAPPVPKEKPEAGEIKAVLDAEAHAGESLSMAAQEAQFEAAFGSNVVEMPTPADENEVVPAEEEVEFAE